MKFTINTKEFKNVMSLVKTVADCAANAKVTSHSVCLLRAFPNDKKLVLEFSLHGSFLTYTFEDVQLDNIEEGAVNEVKRSIDLGALAALKFSGTTVSIVLGKGREGNTLEFSSGKLKGKLILSHSDVEKAVEEARPDENAVELSQTFMISDFLAALTAHIYGAHHNAVSAARRPVKIYNRKTEDDPTGKILFASKETVLGALITKPMTSPFKESFSYYVVPKPFRAVLDALSQDVSPVFNFGMSRDLWRLSHGTRINIWFPNIVQETKAELEDLRDKVDGTPGFTLKTTTENLQKTLIEIAPFTSGSALSAKDDTPAVRFVINGTKVNLEMNTAKARDINVEFDDVEFQTNGIEYNANEVVQINSRFLAECVAGLAANETKATKDKKAEPLSIIWYPHNNEVYPVKGRMVCIKQGNNYYWLSRITERVKTL